VAWQFTLTGLLLGSLVGPDGDGRRLPDDVDRPGALGLGLCAYGARVWLAAPRPRTKLEVG
jgi:hypothetical protein